MKTLLRLTTDPLKMFILTCLLINLPLWTMPINLFNGVVVFKQGTSSVKLDAPLSLSYFIGLGYNEADMTNIETFYLKTEGIILSIAFCLGFPGLMAYRAFLRKQKSADSSTEQDPK